MRQKVSPPVDEAGLVILQMLPLQLPTSARSSMFHSSEMFAVLVRFCVLPFPCAAWQKGGVKVKGSWDPPQRRPMLRLPPSPEQVIPAILSWTKRVRNALAYSARASLSLSNLSSRCCCFCKARCHFENEDDGLSMSRWLKAVRRSFPVFYAVSPRVVSWGGTPCSAAKTASRDLATQ